MNEGSGCVQSRDHRKRTSRNVKETKIRYFRNVLVNHSAVLARTGVWLTYLPLEQRGLGRLQEWHGARI